MNAESINPPQDVQDKTPYDPLVSEFESAEQEAQYTEWLRGKLQKAMDSKLPLIPHDEVMRRMHERLAQLRKTA